MVRRRRDSFQRLVQRSSMLASLMRDVGDVVAADAEALSPRRSGVGSQLADDEGGEPVQAAATSFTKNDEELCDLGPGVLLSRVQALQVKLEEIHGQEFDYEAATSYLKKYGSLKDMTEAQRALVMSLIDGEPRTLHQAKLSPLERLQRTVSACCGRLKGSNVRSDLYATKFKEVVLHKRLQELRKKWQQVHSARKQDQKASASVPAGPKHFTGDLSQLNTPSEPIVTMVITNTRTTAVTRSTTLPSTLVAEPRTFFPGASGSSLLDLKPSPSPDVLPLAVGGAPVSSHDDPRERALGRVYSAADVFGAADVAPAGVRGRRPLGLLAAGGPGEGPPLARSRTMPAGPRWTTGHVQFENSHGRALDTGPSESLVVSGSGSGSLHVLRPRALRSRTLLSMTDGSYAGPDLQGHVQFENSHGRALDTGPSESLVVSGSGSGSLHALRPRALRSRTLLSMTDGSYAGPDLQDSGAWQVSGELEVEVPVGAPDAGLGEHPRGSPSAVVKEESEGRVEEMFGVLSAPRKGAAFAAGVFFSHGMLLPLFLDTQAATWGEALFADVDDLECEGAEKSELKQIHAAKADTAELAAERRQANDGGAADVAADASGGEAAREPAGRQAACRQPSAVQAGAVNLLAPESAAAQAAFQPAKGGATGNPCKARGNKDLRARLLERHHGSTPPTFAGMGRPAECTVCKSCGEWRWNSKLENMGYRGSSCNKMLPKPRVAKATQEEATRKGGGSTGGGKASGKGKGPEQLTQALQRITASLGQLQIEGSATITEQIEVAASALQAARTTSPPKPRAERMATAARALQAAQRQHSLAFSAKQKAEEEARKARVLLEERAEAVLQAEEECDAIHNEGKQGPMAGIIEQLVTGQLDELTEGQLAADISKKFALADDDLDE
ncbi:unnamed protein product [Prorocentrum cordatum]|nr:unnamed protein product [Polarella glacialis]